MRLAHVLMFVMFLERNVGVWSNTQEVYLLSKENFQVFEKHCRWEAHDIMEIPLDFADKQTPETLAQSLVVNRTAPLTLSYLDREATRPINTLSAVHIRVQQTSRVIAKCDKGPVIKRTTSE